MGRLGIPIVGIAMLLLLAVPSAAGRPLAPPVAPLATQAPVVPGPAGPTGALFVAPDGSDRNACTLAAPCRQIGAALLHATPGAVISVATGTYRAVSVTGIVGLASAPIVIQASGPRVVLRAGTDPDDPADSLRIVDSAYVTVEGLSADGASGSDVLIEGSHNVTVANGSFDNASAVGILVDASSQVALTNDRIEGTSAGPGIEVRGPAAGVAIVGGLLARNQGPGLRVLPGSGNGSAASAVTGLLLEDTVLRANAATGSAAVDLVVVQGSIVANDLLYGNLGGGIDLLGGASGPGPRGDLVGYDTVVLGSSDRWALTLSNASGANTVEDNIFVRAGSLPTGIAYGSAADANATESDHNILSEVRPALGSAAVPLATWQSEGYETDSFTASPTSLFVNSRADDFDLLPTSAAIGRGVALPGITTDLDGAARPVDGPTDLGCFEYVPTDRSPLTLSIDSASTSGPAPFTAELTARSSGGVAPYTYLWNFGDGTEASGAEVDHTYRAPGVYTVELVGTDGRGDRSVGTLNLTVVAPGGPGFPVTFRPLDLPPDLAWSIALDGTTISGTGALTVLDVPASTLVLAAAPVYEAQPYLRWTPPSAVWVNVTGPASVPIEFTPYVYLQNNASGAGGTVSPGSGWWPDGASIGLTAVARPGYVFDGWSGTGSDSYTGPQRTAGLVLAASIAEVAHFALGPPATAVGPITRTAGTFVWPTLTADWSIVALSAVVLAAVGLTNYRGELRRRFLRSGRSGVPIVFPAPWMEAITPAPPAASASPPPWLESP